MRDRYIDDKSKELGLNKTLANEENIQDIREKELQEKHQKESVEVSNRQEQIKRKDEEKRREQYQGSKNQYFKRSNKKINSLKKDLKVKEVFKSDLREKINPHLKKFTQEKYIYKLKDKDKNRVYKISLSRSQIGTLYEIGRFSVIQKKDFLKNDYRNTKTLNKDIKHLLKHGLIKVNVSYTQTKGRIETVSLTKKGADVLKELGVIKENEKIYFGKIRQREQAFHDSRLYRVFQKEAKKLLEKGAKNIRVYLDKELKEKLNKEIHTLKNKEKISFEKAKEIASKKFNIPIVNGKVVIPDLQIEYEGRDGQQGRVNIEFATKDYRSSNIREKADAGFTIYSDKKDAPKLAGYLSGSNSPLGKIRDDMEIFVI